MALAQRQDGHPAVALRLQGVLVARDEDVRAATDGGSKHGRSFRSRQAAAGTGAGKTTSECSRTNATISSALPQQVARSIVASDLEVAVVWPKPAIDDVETGDLEPPRCFLAAVSGPDRYGTLLAQAGFDGSGCDRAGRRSAECARGRQLAPRCVEIWLAILPATSFG